MGIESYVQLYTDLNEWRENEMMSEKELKAELDNKSLVQLIDKGSEFRSTDIYKAIDKARDLGLVSFFNTTIQIADRLVVLQDNGAIYIDLGLMDLDYLK